MDMRILIQKAIEARKNSYAPYSRFYVGSALLTENNKIYTGCNIENSSFGAGICAERVAVFKAISEGEKIFKKIAIVCGEENKLKFCVPCGICLQVLSEFCDDEFEIITAVSDMDYKKYTLKDLLPNAFNLNK